MNGGVRDYTEFQSQLLERWLSTDEVINQFLVHYRTGAVIPKELVSKIKKGDLIISLDKEGINLSTEKLRLNFDNWVSSSRDISFIIGGPDGISKSLIDKSDFCWALSNLTFPHSVVPVLVIEQIYRVWSMTQNHPYHK